MNDQQKIDLNLLQNYHVHNADQERAKNRTVLSKVS
jgi:hypothetical protein